MSMTEGVQLQAGVEHSLDEHRFSAICAPLIGQGDTVPGLFLVHDSLEGLPDSVIPVEDA